MTLDELNNLKQKYNIPIIFLDFYNSSYNVIQSKQLDSCRYIICHFTENGIERTLKENEIPRIRLLKPDNTYVYNECEILEDKSVLIHLTEQMLASTGKARADIQISSPDGIYSTKIFYLNIEKTAYPNDAIETSNEFDALNDLLQRENERYQIVLNLEKELNENEKVRQSNENTRKQNETSRITSENSRISSEKSRVYNENTRILSENTRTDNENTREQEESKRQSNETLRVIEENARKANESNRSSAENIRKSNENARISNEEQRQSSETFRQTNEGNRNKDEYSRQNAESIRQDNENNRMAAEDARQGNEATRQSQEEKRQSNTSTAISNANNAAKNANDKANDLQTKLDNHHFVLTNELENSVSSTSTVHASTANAVKTAYDKAVSVENTINSNKNNWNDKYTKSEIDNKFSTLESNIDWKESVSTYADIAKTYPNPQDGWTVNVKDTDYTYRYSGTAWVAISANAIPKATKSVDGLLSKEDKINYDDANSKKHTHSNKSVLDGITSALVTTWNTVTNKLDKTGDASNVTNTITTASTRANLSTGEKLSISLGKIAKWFSDLKTVAFSGSYNDLSNKPSSMPANGGNSTTVNGHTVNSDVPANAKFTDTNTWRGIQNNLTSDSTSDSLSAAQGKILKALVDAKTSNAGTLTGIKMNGASKGTSGVVDLGTVLTGGKQSTTSTADGGSNVYTFSDGSTITVKNGTKGSTGATGSPGTAGKNGSNGTSAAWFTGTAVIGTATSATAFTVSGSKAGDMYLNTSTYNVYRASATNNWIYVCNIKGATGAKGADGKNGTNGTNATTTATGTSSTFGLTKLYTGTGTATDGTMTQNAIKRALDGKAASSHTHSQYYDSTISRTANTVLAAPNGSNGRASFRKLVAADIPSLPYLSAGGNLLDSGIYVYPRVTTTIGMALGDDPFVISTLVGACSNTSGDYRARMKDSILISFFASGYGELLHRGDCTINPANVWSELKFPSSGYSSQINASATITSENKVASTNGGILKLKIVPKTDIMLVVEYSLGLTSIIY